jgi:hypothetical protein
MMKNIDRHDVQKVLAYWVVDHKDIHSALKLLGCKYTDDINKWLLSDYLPFTEFELELMKRIDQKFHWIARDESGRLACFSEKPSREGRYWHPDGECLWRDLPLDMFHNIQWSDEEPVCIDDYVKRG